MWLMKRVEKKSSLGLDLFWSSTPAEISGDIEHVSLEAAVEYFNGDELAGSVWRNKYALRDKEGNVVETTPVDTHRRLAKEFARIEANYPNPMSEEEIFGYLSDWTVVAQGSPMSAIGNPYQLQSLSNCLVVPNPVDSYGGILFSDQQLVQLMKRRCGVGIDISSIRPKGLPTSNAAGTTDGIGVFMERYSNSCREVAQGGRRGALMISIHCLHPDIETFIAIKQDKTKVTGANVSVRVTQSFMEAVRSDSEVTLQWPVDVPLAEAKFIKPVRAKEIWDKLIEANWNSAEPGILFWDTVVSNSIPDLFNDFKTLSTNPCGEVPLSAHDSCRLLLINLTKFVVSPFTDDAFFDYTKFSHVTALSQRLMDDLVDLEIEAIGKIINKVTNDPEPKSVKQVELDLWGEILKAATNGRRTGLGITGLGDAIAMLGIKFGSDRSVEVTSQIYTSLAKFAHASSINLAKERGSCSAWDVKKADVRHPMLDRLRLLSSTKDNQDLATYGRRNIALTTTAPAGSMSIMTQTTSGCEPVFMLEYKRRKKVNPNDPAARVDFVDDLGDKWSEHTIYHHGLKKWMEVTGETDITKSPYYGATAIEINWEKSVELQAAAQKWVEHSISKTCNLPSHVTKEQVSDLYFKAWEFGCKGFTIYRDGSRSGVLVANEPKKEGAIVSTKAPKRPAVLKCDIHRTTISGESYVMLVGLLNNQPYEVFCGLSKNIGLPKSKITGTITKRTVKNDVAVYDLAIPSGEDEIVISNVVDLFDNPLYGAFTRTLSLSLRHGVPVQFIVEQLRKDKHSDMTSFASAVARVLSKHYIADGTKVTSEKSCKECGSTNIAYQAGCATCLQCGNSKCG
jgi:ribonucleoside-diphosphate reductase alpha chain